MRPRLPWKKMKGKDGNKYGLRSHAWNCIKDEERDKFALFA